MRCEAYSHDILLDYRRGKVPEDERVRIERHLQVCGDCMRAYLAASKIADVFAVAVGAQTKVRDDVDRRVLEFARESAVVQRRRRRMFALHAAAFAASLLAAIAVVVALQPEPHGHSPLLMGGDRAFVPTDAVDSGHTLETEAELVYARGDLNRDFRIDIADAQALLDLLEAGQAVTPERADINSDGRVDIADVMLLVEHETRVR